MAFTPPLAVQKLLARAHAMVLKLSGGRVASAFGDAPVLLLTTVGRRTGRSRTVPLLYVADDGAFIVVGSNGGRDHHPDWYRNLLHRPEAMVEVRGERLTVTGEEVDPDERARLWARFTAMWPGYEKYAASTDRRIPVVRLARADER